MTVRRLGTAIALGVSMRTPRYVTARSSGLKLCYTRAGRDQPAGGGPPLLLVHGFMSSRRAFDGLIQLLSRHRRVYALDLPGYGDSARPESLQGAYDRGFFAQAVIDFADAIGVGEFIIIGHSMGGGVSQEVARRVPQRVQQLVLINSVGVEVPWLAKLAAIPVLGAMVFALFFTVMRLIAWVGMDRPIACARSVAHATLKRTLARLASARASLSRLRVPTTLLWGGRDTLLKTTEARRLRDLIPGATLTVLPRLGHFPASDDPTRVCRGILDTLRR